MNCYCRYSVVLLVSPDCSCQAVIGPVEIGGFKVVALWKSNMRSDVVGRRHDLISGSIEIQGCCLRFWGIGRPSLYHTDKRNHKLSDFFKSVSHNPSLAKEVLFNIAGDRFGVTFGLVWLVVEIHIIRPKALQGHVWPPAIIPDLKVVADFRQMINPFDKSDSF